MKYKCILFDLDHTLWDFETNSSTTLADLFKVHDLQTRGIAQFTEFKKAFSRINTDLWIRYDAGLIGRDEIRLHRFRSILAHFGIHDEQLSMTLSDEYVIQSPKKSALMPNAIESLEYLAGRYPITIITNGFDEIQGTKLASSGITHYFKSVVTSARAGHKKPAREIFDFALAENGFAHHEAIMIGDNLITDIGGARNAKVDTIYYNPERSAHAETVNFEIHDLKQLLQIL
ncbi:MAG TPA: YjjG family noncanonical pyrimidine nucleotidase [Cyclobacteriaceae bacterium]|nr:YjjG family noncanonical pyrimidine nucleotidase [Cyclobacteriaceae bacterium]